MDLSNSSLLISYESGTTKMVDITPSMISGFQSNTAGLYSMQINYNGYSISVEYTVSKKVPTFTVPQLSDIEYSGGLVLGSIQLPSGFTWDEPDTLLDIGEFAYSVTYTPNNTNMYHIVTDILVHVKVVERVTPIVIYEVYGGGGNNSAIYNQDYIVLYNNLNSNINLSGYSLQYNSGSGYNVIPLSGIIYAQQYYVIGLYVGSEGASLPVGVNLQQNTNISASSGRFAIVNGINPITGPSSSNVIDFLGYGAVSQYEGTVAPSTGNSTSIKRISNKDTNNNYNDFLVGTPDLTYVLDSLSATNLEAVGLKTHYKLGSTLDLIGFLQVVYSNGSYKTVPFSEADVSGFNSLSVGTKTLEIEYLGLVTTYEYYVVDYSDQSGVNVYYIDIGASGGNPGEASFIKVGDIDILVDAGDSDSETRNELLQFLGTQVVDGVIEYIIATHPDADHIGGMSAVFDAYEVENVIRYSSTSSPTSIRTNFELAIANEGSTVYEIANLVTTTPTLSLTSSVHLRFYDTGFLTSNSTNASSIVFVLEAFDTRILFNGDAESAQEAIYAPLVGDVDVFKMGHHGTANGTSASFLQIIKPEVAVVNNGNYLGNGYNHPTYVAVSRIYQYSPLVPVYSVTGGNGSGSDRFLQRNGDINISIEEDGYVIQSERYGSNPIELSATNYWNNASNSYKQYYYYYRDLTGIEIGNDFKYLLHNVIDDHIMFTYDDAKTYLKETDEDPNNSNNVILFYTGRSEPKSNFGSGVNQWNREHVWAKSHGGFGETKPAGSDLHHLRPTDASVNSTRGSLDFDIGGTKVIDTYGAGSNFSYVKTNVSFEPRDEVKGDVARILFYMAVRYDGSDAPDLELNDLVNNGSSPYMGRLSVLLQWHKDDPVDDFERNRNNVIYSYQKNRNPFIDHPEWAEIIFSR